jgi:hypothetical protein
MLDYKEVLMYKFANEEGTLVDDLVTKRRGIHRGVWLWREYEKWVESGGITEAFKTEEELSEEAAIVAEQTKETIRVDGINAARESTGLKKLTVAQAEKWIDNELDSAANTAETVQAIRAIFKKMVPYLLK